MRLLFSSLVQPSYHFLSRSHLFFQRHISFQKLTRVIIHLRWSPHPYVSSLLFITRNVLSLSLLCFSLCFFSNLKSPLCSALLCLFHTHTPTHTKRRKSEPIVKFLWGMSQKFLCSWCFGNLILFLLFLFFVFLCFVCFEVWLNSILSGFWNLLCIVISFWFFCFSN